MSIRKFFLLSLSLALVAVGLHLMSMSQINRGLQIRAQAVMASESDIAAAKAKASGYSSRGVVFGYVGLASAFASSVFLFASARNHEPARRVVVFGALICYLLLQFVLL